MNRKIWLAVICAVLLIAASACSKHVSAPQVIVEIPSGFNGDFRLEMGVKDAPPLEKRGDAYVVPVPRNGKVVTSTLRPHSGIPAKARCGDIRTRCLTRAMEFRWAPRSNFSWEPEKSTRRNRAEKSIPEDSQLRRT